MFWKRIQVLLKKSHKFSFDIILSSYLINGLILVLHLRLLKWICKDDKSVQIKFNKTAIWRLNKQKPSNISNLSPKMEVSKHVHKAQESRYKIDKNELELQFCRMLPTASINRLCPSSVKLDVARRCLEIVRAVRKVAKL